MAEDTCATSRGVFIGVSGWLGRKSVEMRFFPLVSLMKRRAAVRANESQPPEEPAEPRPRGMDVEASDTPEGRPAADCPEFSASCLSAAESVLERPPEAKRPPARGRLSEPPLSALEPAVDRRPPLHVCARRPRTRAFKRSDWSALLMRALAKRAIETLRCCSPATKAMAISSSNGPSVMSSSGVVVKKRENCHTPVRTRCVSRGARRRAAGFQVRACTSQPPRAGSVSCARTSGTPSARA